MLFGALKGTKYRVDSGNIKIPGKEAVVLRCMVLLESHGRQSPVLKVRGTLAARAPLPSLGVWVNMANAEDPHLLCFALYG